MTHFPHTYLRLQSDGIGEKTWRAQNRSRELLNIARDALNQTEGTLKNELNEAQENVNNLADQNRNSTDEIDRIDG